MLHQYCTVDGVVLWMILRLFFKPQLEFHLVRIKELSFLTSLPSDLIPAITISVCVGGRGSVAIYP